MTVFSGSSPPTRPRRRRRRDGGAGGGARTTTRRPHRPRSRSSPRRRPPQRRRRRPRRVASPSAASSHSPASPPSAPSPGLRRRRPPRRRRRRLLDELPPSSSAASPESVAVSRRPRRRRGLVGLGGGLVVRGGRPSSDLVRLGGPGRRGLAGGLLRRASRGRAPGTAVSWRRPRPRRRPPRRWRVSAGGGRRPGPGRLRSTAAASRPSRRSTSRRRLAPVDVRAGRLLRRGLLRAVFLAGWLLGGDRRRTASAGDLGDGLDRDVGRRLVGGGRRLTAAFLVVAFFAAAVLAGRLLRGGLLGGAFFAAVLRAGAAVAGCLRRGLRRGVCLAGAVDCEWSIRGCPRSICSPRPAAPGCGGRRSAGPRPGEPRTAESLRVAATLLRVCVTRARLRRLPRSPASAEPSLSPTPRPRRGLATIVPPLCRATGGRRERRRVDRPDGSGRRRPRRVSHTADAPGHDDAGRRVSGHRHGSGSPISPVASSSGPCARRVSSGASPGSSPVTAARPDSTSSGRTAGTACRSTRSSDAASPARVEHGEGHDGGARQSNSRSPFFVIRSTSTSSVARKRRDGGRGVVAGRSTSTRQWLASSRSASEPPGDSTTSSTSRPSGSASSSAACDVRGVDDLGEADLEVLRLAGRPGRRRAGVRDPRVRVEARGVRHRHPGPEDRPLEGPAEVAVAGEPEPAALGVADPESLDGRGLLLGLLTHRRKATAQRAQASSPGGVDRADPDAVEPGGQPRRPRRRARRGASAPGRPRAGRPRRRRRRPAPSSRRPGRPTTRWCRRCRCGRTAPRPCGPEEEVPLLPAHDGGVEHRQQRRPRLDRRRRRRASSGSTQPVVAAVEGDLDGVDVGQARRDGGGWSRATTAGRLRCPGPNVPSQRRTSSAYPSRSGSGSGAPPASAPSASTAGGRSASGRRCGRAPARPPRRAGSAPGARSGRCAPYDLPTATSIRPASSGTSSRSCWAGARRRRRGGRTTAAPRRRARPPRRRRGRRPRPPWPAGRAAARRPAREALPQAAGRRSRGKHEERAAHGQLLDQGALVVQRPVDVGDGERRRPGPAAER